MPIHLLAGPDDVSIDDALRDLLAATRLPADLAEANTTRLDGSTFSMDAFRFACEAVPFLASGRVVICRGVIAALGARDARATTRRDAGRSTGAEVKVAPARRGRAAAAAPPPSLAPDEALAAYLPSVPATTHAFFLEGEAPAPSTSLSEALAARGVHARAFPIPVGDEMVRWLRDRARRVAGADAPPSGAMTIEAAQVLAGHVGSDLRLAASEVLKLVTHAGQGRAVEARDVALLVPQSVAAAKVWELTQAMLDGQRDRAGARLVQLIDGADFRPEQVIAAVRSAVAQHLNVMARSATGADDATIARELRMQPFAVKMTRDRASRLSDRALAYMHRQALEADHSLKVGKVTPRLAAELLVIELAARAVQAMQMRARPRA